MVTRLFRTLPDDEDCHIIFSERGKTFNDQSLTVALQKARNPKAGISTANLKNSIEHDSQAVQAASTPHSIQNKTEGLDTKFHAVTVIEKKPSRDHIGLQIIDYFLWTIWQIYERDNIDYFSLLRDKYQVIMDIDDTRTSEHGMFYSKNNRISLDKIKKRK
jgi:hypothetical protein